MNITEISIRRPTLIVVLFSILTILGVVGFKNLGYELMPNFNPPMLFIRTIYPGAEPSEVENSVSKKLEDALAQLEGIDYVVTKSLPNASALIVNFKYGVNLDKAILDAQRLIENIKEELPDGIHNPVISAISPNDLPVLTLSVVGEMLPTELSQKLKQDYLPRIQQIKGVADIIVIGGEEREIQIKVDKEKLKLNRISLLQVVEAVNRAGLDIPAGEIKTASESSQVRMVGKFESFDEIENILIATPIPGNPVYVKDVAVLSDGIKATTSISRFNGEESMALMVRRQDDANAVEVADAVLEEIQKIETENAGTRFVVTDNSTDNTRAAVKSVVFDLALAVLLIGLVMLLFLRSFKNALIVMVAIPTSLITAFAVMWLLGYSLNLMTLLAMSLIIGILIDDATVVLENIQRHLDMGKEKRKAAFEGRMEIGYSAVSITLVDVVVFLPILFLQVLVADILKQFSVVVITSTLTSLLVGFTLTPWMASRIGEKDNLQPTNRFNRFLLWFERILDRFIHWYGGALDWVLKHKLAFSAFVFSLFVATTFMMMSGVIGIELIATGDQGKFKMSLEYDRSTSIEQNNISSKEIEEYILSYPEVSSLFSNIGGPASGLGSLGMGAANKTELIIQLKDPKETQNTDTEQFMISLRNDLMGKFPGINFSMVAIGMVPRTAPIEITFSGNDFDRVYDAATTLKEAIEIIPGADNVRLSVEEGSPELKVVPDKDKMQKLGLSTAYVGMNLRTAFSGNDDAKYSDKGVEFPIRIWLDDFNRQNLQDVEQLSILSPSGTAVEISEFATIVRDNAPSLLERLDRRPALTLTSDALGKPSGTLAAEVVSYVNKNPLPEGVNMTWGSDIKMQNESFAAMGGVLIVSFLLIYLVMVALYDNYIYPFVALFAIPLAIIGALLALNLSLSHLSLFAILGMVMLMGLVTKNSILIVDFTNQIKAEGKHYREALIIAGKERMRPILMTTLSMAVGMLPIALAKGSGAEWKNGLAWVIIGGLLSSLVLTIFIVPMVYYLVDRAKEKWFSRD